MRRTQKQRGDKADGEGVRVLCLSLSDNRWMEVIHQWTRCSFFVWINLITSYHYVIIIHTSFCTQFDFFLRDWQSPGQIEFKIPLVEYITSKTEKKYQLVDITEKKYPDAFQKYSYCRNLLIKLQEQFNILFWNIWTPLISKIKELN